jgi:hypothetical protein
MRFDGGVITAMDAIKIGNKELSRESVEALRERYDGRYKQTRNKMLKMEAAYKNSYFLVVFKGILSILLFLIVTYGLVILKNIEYSIRSGEMRNFSEIIDKMID